MKSYVFGVILISASIFGVTLLFYYSLMEIASGRVPFGQVSQLMMKTMLIFLILVAILIVGLLLISIPVMKKETVKPIYSRWKG